MRADIFGCGLRRGLRLRLCVIAHAGSRSGHLGYKTALQVLHDWVFWVGMAEDIKLICSSCLHCLPTRKGHRIPRPLGEACHGVRPNQVLHFDYLYICPRSDTSINYQWLFVVRDVISSNTHVRASPPVVSIPILFRCASYKVSI